MNNLKVLHIATRLAGGGAEKNIVDTVLGLDALGYNIHLMLGSGSERAAIEKLNLPRSINLSIIPELVHNVSLVNDYKAYRKIVRLMELERYDIVHTHMSKAGIIGRLAAKKASVPFIVHGVHGAAFPRTVSFYKRVLYKMAEVYCGRFTDRFVAVGEDIKRIYISSKVGNDNKYSVIRSGHDIAHYDRALQDSKNKRQIIRRSIGLSEIDVCIGMVSRLEESKGYKYLLKSAAHVLKTIHNVKFVIVGDGNQMNDLKNMARDMNIESGVIFTGYRTDIADIITAFDIAVFTSLREGLPQFLVQAALLAKPIVTFDVEGACEVIEDGKNGFIVPIKDLDAFNKKVIELAGNERLRQEMGANSRCKVDSSWTTENMITQTDSLYKELLNIK